MEKIRIKYLTDKIEKLRYIDGGGIRQGGFIKVMSEDGVRGYISEAALETNRIFCTSRCVPG